MDCSVKFNQALKELESNSEFNKIDNRITGVFYTLYSRCKRLYFAMDVLKKTSNEHVNYTEILPLLRVFLESYFHISYVINEEDLDKVKEGYEHLTKYSGRLIAGKLKHSEELGELGRDFIEKIDSTYTLPKEFDFLEDMGKLSGKSGKRELYRKQYSPLNSFVHFNPATFINYGNFIDNKFVYNTENVSERNNVLSLVDRFMYIFIVELVIFLEDNILEEKINLILKDVAKKLVEPST